MNKSDLLVSIAQLTDGDARLEAIEKALSRSEPAIESRGSLKLLTMGQACATLGVSRPTLWRMIKENVLQAIEIRRGSRRIPEQVLIEFIEGRRAASPQTNQPVARQL